MLWPPSAGVALGEACTIVLRGASTHILDEAERSLHDALCVLKETVADARVVYGGGWPEIRMAKAVEELASRTPGGGAGGGVAGCLGCCARAKVDTGWHVDMAWHEAVSTR